MRLVVSFSCCFLFLATSVQAQSVDTIIDRNIEAVGGRKALERIVSTTLTGVVTSAAGRTGRFTRHTKRPNLLYTDMSWGEMQWSTAFNGRSAWERDGRGEARTLNGRAAARARLQGLDANDRLLTAGRTSRVTLEGRDRVRERPVFVVRAISPDGFKRTLFFDTEKYLILKEEHRTESGLEVRVFDDYRRVGQVMEPHRIEWQRGDERFLLTVERVTHNAVADERIFEIAQTGPQVNVSDLLNAVRRNQEQLETRLQSYAYLQTRTERDLDENGDIKKEEVRVFEVFYLAGRPVRKLVTRNGQQLNQGERRREDERVTRIVRDYEQRRATQAQRGDDGRRISPDLGPRQPPSDERFVSAYLRMSDFRNPRREHLGGRPVIVAEFQPKRGATPRDVLESQISKTAGVLWIDEQAQQVIRSDSFLLENTTAIARGSSMMSEQTMIADDAWLPSSGEMNVSFALWFGKQLRRQVSFRFSDYKKFNADSDYQVKLPEAKP